jgi:hypothetical protein
MSNFQLILDALDKYSERTGINLQEHPFADKVKNCDSPSAVLILLEENLKAFKDYREQNRKFIDCLNPVVQFVHAFSGILSEAASPVSRGRLSNHIASFLILFTPQGAVPTCKANLRRNWYSPHRACPSLFIKQVQYPGNIRRLME